MAIFRSNMFTVLCGAILGSIITGYSMGLYGNTLGQPAFFMTMNLPLSPKDPDYHKTSTFISTGNGIFYGAGFFGTLFTSWVSERWGRVQGFRVAALFALPGAALQAGAVNQGMYLAARIISGFAAGQTLGAMSTYYSEVSLPQRRGMHSGLHALGIELGACCAAWIGLGTSFKKDSTFGWRFPIALTTLIAIVLIIVTFYLPETPRWLMRHDRQDAALEILRKLHGSSMLDGGHVYEREYEQIRLQSVADVEATKKYGKWQLFTDASYRKRLIVTTGLIFFGNGTGFLVIYNYAVILYTSLGLTNVQSLALASGWITETFFAIAIGNLIVDKIGRRKLLLIGFTGLTFSLAIFTACLARYLETGSRSYAAAAVSFIFVSALPYGICLDQNLFTIVTEIFPNHLRSLASCISISSFFLAEVLWLISAPYAIAAINWKFYLIFVIIGCFDVVYVYFLIPETARISLEELDALFQRPVVVKWDDLNVNRRSDGEGSDLQDEKGQSTVVDLE